MAADDESDVSGVVVELCEDTRSIIEQFILDERHVTARLLLRRIGAQLRDVVSRDIVSARDLDVAAAMWIAMKENGCYDATIISTARRHHDVWFQLLEDPYDMRAEYASHMERFQYGLETILHVIVRSYN